MAKVPHQVKVTLRAEEEVVITVWCEEDEEPTDLSEAEENEAIARASAFADWEVDDVREVTT